MDNSTQKYGFFDGLDALVQAMHEGRVHPIDKNLPDNLKHLKRLHVVEAMDLPLEDYQAVHCLADVLYGGFQKQFGKDEGLDKERFDYGVATMENITSQKPEHFFYYVWPEDKSLDVEVISGYVSDIKNLFKDTQIVELADDNKVSVGPFDALSYDLFMKVYERLVTFGHHRKLHVSHVQGSDGLRLSFDRDDYLGLFEKEFGFSPLLRQEQIIPSFVFQDCMPS